MKREEIVAKLQTIFDKLFIEPVEVTEQLSARDVSEWDSLLQLSLVVAIEKAFAIRFRVGEVEATRNVGDLVNIIENRVAGG